MKKRDKLIKSGGIVTDKEMPIALLGISGVEQYGIKKVYGNILNAVTLDFLNMVTHRARERWMTQIDIDGGEITWTMLEEIWAEIPNMFNMIIISEYEIRKFFEKKFRKKYGDSALIYKHMKNIGSISLDGLIPVRYERDGQKCWHHLDVTGGFAEVHCTTDDNLPEWYEKFREIIDKGKLKGEEKRIFIVRFIGTWGLNYVLNVINDRVRIFPPRFYKNLSPNARQLFRMISARKNKRGTFTLQQLHKLFKWVGDWGNILKQISDIEKIWGELKSSENRFIHWFNRKNEGEEIEWSYERNEGWFYLQKGEKNV